MTMTTTSEDQAKVAALQATVFGALSGAQLHDVARVSAVRHIPAGETLCQQDEFGQDVFVIASGSVVVVADEVEVAERGAGDILGDWALFGSGYRSASVLARTATTAIVVDARELDSLLMAVPAAAALIGPHDTAR